jgi:molybdopterin synthase catalytic subunit
MIELTHDPIDFAAVTESVRSPACGAVVLFLGTVRDMTNGARTLRLAYESYPAMAEAKMRELEAEARKLWPLHEVRIVHRLGTLELGEVSVAIAVSSPHRADAFDAGRWLIDRFKEVVPIWKQEHWADGTTEWVHPGVSDLRSATEESSPPLPRERGQG